MITMSFRQGDVTEDGYTAAECARTLHTAGADIVGLNCMNDPKHMYPLIREMRDAFDGYLAAQPAAFRCTDETPWFTGLPSFPDRLEPTQLTRYELGEFASRAREMGVNYIGGCCGCKATHMREMAKAARKVRREACVDASRRSFDERDRVQPVQVAVAMTVAAQVARVRRSAKH